MVCDAGRFEVPQNATIVTGDVLDCAALNVAVDGHDPVYRQLCG